MRRRMVWGGGCFCIGMMLFGAMGWTSGCAQLLDIEGDVDIRGGGSSSSSSGAGTSSSSGGSGGGSASSSSGGGSGGGSASSSSGGGTGGTGGGAPTYSWTATDPLAAGGAGTSACKDYAYALPPWLVFTSPSVNRSSQTSDESLCIGYDANDARARNVGPKNNAKWGLSIETGRTNLVKQSRSWSGGGEWSTLGGGNAMMVDPNPQTDPAGTMLATKFDNDSMANATGQESPYQAVSSVRALSTWVMGMGAPIAGCKKFGGGSENCYARFRHWADGSAAYANITETKWRRISFTHEAKQNNSISLNTKDSPAGAGVISGISSFAAFAAQAEDASYPSSYIPTFNTTVTRAKETLYIPAANAPDVLKNGFFEMTLRFAPNFAHDEISANYHLLQIRDSEFWRVYMDFATKKIVVWFNNKEAVSSVPLEFARETEIEIKVSNLEGSTVKLEVKGTAAGAGMYDAGTPVLAAPTDKNIFILSHYDGAEECSDLRYFEFK